MKRKLTSAQGMVEYALLLTMVAVPMIVIYATLGNAVGQVWQSMIDNLEDNSMFTIKNYTLHPTSTKTIVVPSETPTITYTIDPLSTATDTPTATEIPTQTDTPTATEIPPTATHFIPATMTFTATPVPPTETPTDIPTATATSTPVYVRVSDLEYFWNGSYVTIQIYTKRNTWLTVENINLGTTTVIACDNYCSIQYYVDDLSGGYVYITSTKGDEIFYYYYERPW